MDTTPHTPTAAGDRPGPPPRAPWMLAMQWHNLLFMHWPLAAEAMRPLIPAGLTLDLFDGTAWIGIVPFMMRGVRPRLVPAMPWISSFAELNVRTYVTARGKPGVFFFSLDAANPLAVRAARAGFHLPYYDARMAVTEEGDSLRYASARTHHLAPAAALRCRYRPTSAVMLSQPGSLEAWLTERYCLYAANGRGTVWRGDIDHPRWPLQAAEAEIELNTMVDPLRRRLPSVPPLLHFSRRQDVVAWPPVTVR